jgi:hypothetical protein
VAATRGSIRIEGAGRASISKESLRDALNSTASCMAPNRYPTYEKDGYRLPQTVPSRWYRASQEGNSLVLQGRGWGHGIGMVQWGAYGKAERGLGYDEILAAYYGGLTPEPAEVPGAIRILIAEGLTRLTIVPSGEARVEPDPGRAGPWLVTGGRGVRLQQGDRPAPVLQATGFTGPPRARPGQPYAASLTTSDDAGVTLEFLGKGDLSAAAPPVVLEEGETRVEVVLPDLPEGRYDLRAVVSDGVDVVTTAAIPVRVRAAAAEPTAAPTQTQPAQAAPGTSSDEGPPLGLVIPGALLVVLLVAIPLGLTRRRGRGLHRP